MSRGRRPPPHPRRGGDRARRAGRRHRRRARTPRSRPRSSRRPWSPSLLGVLAAVGNIAGGLPVAGLGRCSAPPGPAIGLVRRGRRGCWPPSCSSSARTVGFVASAVIGVALRCCARSATRRPPWLRWLTPFGWCHAAAAPGPSRAWWLLAAATRCSRRGARRGGARAAAPPRPRRGRAAATARARPRARRGCGDALGAGLAACSDRAWSAGPSGIGVIGVADGRDRPDVGDLLDTEPTPRDHRGDGRRRRASQDALVFALASVIAVVITCFAIAVVDRAPPATSTTGVPSRCWPPPPRAPACLRGRRRSPRWSAAPGCCSVSGVGDALVGRGDGVGALRRGGARPGAGRVGGARRWRCCCCTRPQPLGRRRLGRAGGVRRRSARSASCSSCPAGCSASRRSTTCRKCPPRRSPGARAGPDRARRRAAASLRVVALPRARHRLASRAMWQPEPGWQPLPGGTGRRRSACGGTARRPRRRRQAAARARTRDDPPSSATRRHFAYWRRAADVALSGVVAGHPGCAAPRRCASRRTPRASRSSRTGSRTPPPAGCSLAPCARPVRRRRPRRPRRGWRATSCATGWPASSAAAAGRPWPAPPSPTSPTTCGAPRRTLLDALDALPQVAQHGDPAPANLPGPRRRRRASPSTGRTSASGRSAPTSATSRSAPGRTFEPLARGLPARAARRPRHAPTRCALGARVTAVYTALSRGRVGAGPGRRRRGRAGREVPPPRASRRTCARCSGRSPQIEALLELT